MKWGFWIFAALYALAALALLVGTYGLFGQPQDPLSGVFLLPLGLPWNIIADNAGVGGPLPMLFAPAINGAILFSIWQRRRKKS